jgi:tetratricopeptide (TPR) repeat protein
MTEAATFSLSHRDYFISRSTVDAAFAGWIGKLIAAQGKTYIEQSEHFGHEDFMNAMHKAFLSGARIVALYSQSYLDSKYCVREATEALKGDPANEQQRLIPLRIEPCAPAGMLNITYTDLLAERRQADASALATRICRALGLAAPDLSRLPTLPEGLLVAPPRLIHPRIRISRTGLAPRPDLMAQIVSAMSHAGGNSLHMVAAVAGMAGAGKTVLARDFAVQHQDAYYAVWWIDAERRDASGSNMLADIAALGVELSERIKTEAQTNIERAARETLTLIEAAGHARTFLLIYDNVNRPQDIETWTPRSGAHILLTTRYAEWDDMVAKVDVGVLDRKAAIEFLLRRGKKKAEQREAAGTLADTLDCLPLALDHAGSYCALGRRPSFAEYLAMLASRLDYQPTGTSGVYGRSVHKTFAIALQRVIEGEATIGAKACPGAQKVLGVAALLAPVPIPFAIFSHPRLGEADVDGAFRALAEVSLIATGEDEHGNGTFTVHRLVQAIMRERLVEAGLTADCGDLGLELLAEAVPNGSNDVANWATFRALAPHALAVLKLEPAKERDQLRAASLGAKIGLYFSQMARYAEARQLSERALAIKEKVLGPEHPDTARSLNNLADVLQARGDLAAARPLHERALAIKEKVLGPEHPDTATSLNNLAHVLQAQGDLAAARPLHERALAISEKALGPEHRDTARSLHNLASLLQNRGDLAAARPLFERALAIFMKALGPEHPDTARSLNKLASLLQDQGDLAAARLLFERALAVKEKVFGQDHPDTARGLNDLAGPLYAQGDLAAARPLLERALAILEKALGPEHPDTARSLNNLASLLREQGDLAAARPLLERALAIHEKALGPEHPDTARCLNAFAPLLLIQGDLAAARPVLERALAITEKVLGPEHPETVTSLDNLALLNAHGDDLAAAQPLLERALAIREKVFGQEHPNTANSLDILAVLLQAQGDLAAAQRLLERALAIREKVLGHEHPDTAQSVNNLAQLLQDQGDLAAAQPLLERARAMRGK